MPVIAHGHQLANLHALVEHAVALIDVCRNHCRFDASELLLCHTARFNELNLSD